MKKNQWLAVLKNDKKQEVLSISKKKMHVKLFIISMCKSSYYKKEEKWTNIMLINAPFYKVYLGDTTI